LQEYLCRRCGATYTSLDAIRLLDPASGAFHCEECRAELEPSVDALGLGAGAGGGAASRQQMQQYAKRMLEMMDQQLRPLTGACDYRKQQQLWSRQRWCQLSKDPAGGASAASVLWRPPLQPLPTLPALALFRLRSLQSN
jgi:hypothetical protein